MFCANGTSFELGWQNQTTMKNINAYILEDDRFYAEMISAHLEMSGIHTRIFNVEQNCVNAIRTSPPDLLILDHKLENSTGLEILEAINLFIKETNVVYLSAQDKYNVVLKALKHGAVDYVEKGDNAFVQLNTVISKLQKHTQNFSLPLDIRTYRLDTDFKVA